MTDSAGNAIALTDVDVIAFGGSGGSRITCDEGFSFPRAPHGCHSRVTGNPSSLLHQSKMDSRLRGNDGHVGKVAVAQDWTPIVDETPFLRGRRH